MLSLHTTPGSTAPGKQPDAEPPGHRAGASTAQAGYRELASVCKACAEPLRLHILRVLQNESLAVSELCSLLAMRQNALSHHLKVLSAAGLVSSRREGNNIFYRRSAAPGLQSATQGESRLTQALLDELDNLPLPEAMRSGLQALQRSRERNSEAFFRLNAHKFREQQDLIAAYEQYADTAAALLREVPLPSRRLALEIGPGDGRFLPVLSSLFAQVVAVDNAPGMLEASRATADAAGLDNIHFVLGDTRSAALEGLAADAAVVNMVLHHTPEPAQVLAEVAARLAPGGVLLLSELCRHDQTWARENCGDLWLGFDPQELGAWAQDCGLEDLASSFLAQRNGFRIQVRLFRHRGVEAHPQPRDTRSQTAPSAAS
jgi:ArsR family transcriptional regulator